MKKIHDEASNGKRGSSYAIRKLGTREFDKSKESFDVPELVENNLDDQQSAEALTYFHQ
jgi:hypothetical protein